MTKRWIYALMVAAIIIVGAIAGPVMAASQGTTAVPAPTEGVSDVGTVDILESNYAGYGSTYVSGTNYVFHSNISSTKQIIYTVPQNHRFRVEDVVFANVQNIGGSVLVTRSSTGNAHLLMVNVPPLGNFNYKFNIILNSGEKLGIKGNGIFSYTITGTLI